MLGVKFYLEGEDCSPGVASQIALKDSSKAAGTRSIIQGFGGRGVQYHEAPILQKGFC